MDQNESKKINRKTVYVLSQDDADRIEKMIELIRNTFWELLASREVTFPNRHSSDCASQVNDNLNREEF